MSRISVPEADAILDREFKVLDHGFVRLVDYMGGDRRIAEAAWVSSYDEVDAEKKTPKAVRRIINYMLRNQHGSPFEHVELAFRIKMPIFVARQWVRHRISELNEMSARYRKLPNDYYVPELKRIKGKDDKNKQGSKLELPDAARRDARASIKDSCNEASMLYDELDDLGLATELSRLVLPVTWYTEWYWKANLRSLFNFLQLRLHPHAQWEIRVYAEIIAEMTKAVAPMAYEAFEEHQLHAVRLSRTEVGAIRGALRQINDQLTEEAAEHRGHVEATDEALVEVAKRFGVDLA